jgi:hypothetical protein
MPLANHSIPPQNNIFLSIFFSLSFTFFTFNPFYILFFIVADFKYLPFFYFMIGSDHSKGGVVEGKDRIVDGYDILISYIVCLLVYIDF